MFADDFLVREYIYVTVQGGQVIPDLYLLAYVGTEEALVLVIRYSNCYSWAH